MRVQTAVAGATAPPITGHDMATAGEFANFVAQQVPVGRRPANFAVPDDVFSRAFSMGFGSPAFLEDKLSLLRRFGVDEDMLVRLRVMALRSEAAAILPVGSPLATSRVIGHLITASPGTVASPVGGAHLEAVLQARQAQAVAGNEPLHLLRTADSPSPASPAGVSYNAFEQWRWTGGGTPGARPTTPGGSAGATFGGWVLAADAKTTFNNLPGFMTEAQAAWDVWRAANPLPAGGSNQFWHAAPGAGRQEIGGYFNVTASGTVESITVFPYRTGGLGAW
jgi:hypothetical protein